MKTYNGINLEYINSKRDNYMSLSDLSQDLTIESLIKLLPTFKAFEYQMVIMKEIENRNELNDNDYFDLLETCNGI